MLDRVEELPPPDLFPDNVERALAEIEVVVGPGVASRLRMFLGKCIKSGLKPSLSGKQWIPFRRYAVVKYEHYMNEAIRTLEKLTVITWDYDEEEGDVLYLSIGEPQPATGVDIGESVIGIEASAGEYAPNSAGDE